MSSDMKTIFTDNKFAYISTCLLFRATSAAAFWCCCSKLICDIINEALYSVEDIILKLTPSPYISYKQNPELLDASIPFTQTVHPLFEPKTFQSSTCDIYINDFIRMNL